MGFRLLPVADLCMVEMALMAKLKLLRGALGLSRL